MSIAVDDGTEAIRVITIDRPEARNALDSEHVFALADAFSSIPPDTRAVVLQGSAGQFCAGADIKGIEGPAFASELRSLLKQIASGRFVSVAAIEGAALGAGTQLALACDVRVAAETALFGIPAVKLGLLVDLWTVRRLSAMVGTAVARAMLLTAETYNAEEALNFGLVQRVGTPGEALLWASEIAIRAPLTIVGHKLMLDALELELPIDKQVEQAYLQAWNSEDLKEGRAAFAERRPAKFTGE